MERSLQLAESVSIRHVFYVYQEQHSSSNDSDLQLKANNRNNKNEEMYISVTGQK